MEKTEAASPGYSVAALVLAALALVGAMVSIYAGPFAPHQTVGVTLGDLTGDVIRSTMRNLKGEAQPAAVARAMTMDDWIGIGVAVLGVLAIVLAIIGLARHESRRLAIGAMGLGIGAVAFQFFTWLALAIIGLLIIMAVMSVVGDFFGGIG